MTTDNNPLAELAARLLEATRARKVEWRTDSDAQFSYTGRGTTAVIRSEEGDGEAPFELVLVNRDGVIVERITSHLPADNWGDREERPWSRLLADVYAAARSNAMNIESEIRNLIGSFDDPPF